MGADVSAERGRYTSQQKADFERKYREMYGENLSREELLERYRMEKLKAERKRRLEEANAAHESERRRRSDDDYNTSRSYHRHSRDRSRDRYDDRHGKEQNDNFRIIKQEQERRQREYHREHRSHRSRDHRDDKKRREHQSRQRRTSSRSRDRSRSSSASSKENRRHRKSSEAMTSPERERDSRSRRDRSSRHKNRDGRERSRKREHSKQSSRSRSKHIKDNSQSESEKERRDTVEDIRKKSSKSKGNASNTVRSKKKRSQAKSEHYKSAPDLTVDRQYGKGPWGRAHDFFGSYEQRPQSWVEEIATDRNSIMPAPVMERQIIYSMPHITPQMDRIGYPLSPGQPFSSIPLQHVYNQQPPGRPRSVDMSAQEPPVEKRTAEKMQSSPTAVKIPPGAVPALGPNASNLTKAKKISKRKERDEHKTKSSKSSQQRSQTLPSKRTPEHNTTPQHGQSASLPRSDGPTPMPRMRSLGDRKSPVAVQSVKVRTLSPNRSSRGKKHKGRITSFSAREDFESLLASDYGASNMMNEDYVSGNYATSYPGNYRPNQEIYVDDVIIRNHPPLDPQAVTDSDSEGVTDEEHVLTLGENLSPNSYGYSSGFDLEIPEGFCFDSDTSANKNSPKKKRAHSKSHEKATTPTAVKPVYGLQGNHKLGKQQTLVLTSIEPISRAKDTKKSDRSRKNADNKSKNQRTASTDQSSSPIRQRTTTSSSMPGTTTKHRHPGSPEIDTKSASNRSPERKSRHSSQQSQSRQDQEPQIHPTVAPVQKSARSQESKGKRTNKRVQHPSKNGSVERIIVPSKIGWSPEKITHDIGVGTKPWKPDVKSTAVQTARKKQRPSAPPAQPIYFLKPISSQEVFIEDSSIVSHSETDMTRSQVTSVTSEQGRTATSYSRSSSMSPTTEYTEQSEVESTVPFQRNSTSRVVMKKHTSSLSSATSFDPEPVRVVQPAMKIGIAESIQADHYTSSGGQVFFITRSRHGSPPPSIKALTDDVKSVDEENDDTQQRSSNAVTQGHTQFDAHDVGKWVLDCYVSDQKLKSNTNQNEPTTPNQSISTSQVRLTKQTAVEYEASFALPSAPDESPTKEQTRVVPLTEASLQNHNGSILRYSSQSSKSSTEVTADNINTEKQASDHGVFQQELLVTRSNMKRHPERDRTPEPAWKSEQYQSKLNHWNTSPSGNVVLAEVCSVNDTDDTSSTISDKIPTKAVKVPSTQQQIQISISKNTRTIRPHNRPRYNEESIVPSSTVTAVNLRQRNATVHSSVSSASTDKDETQSLPKVPVVAHSQVSKELGGPSRYEEAPTINVGKPIQAYPNGVMSKEPAVKPNVPYQQQSQRSEATELVTASIASTRRNVRPPWAKNQPRSFEKQPLRKTPASSFEQQQTEAPQWTKKPSNSARNHNRQPYLEKIARASENSYGKQAYHSSKPQTGSFDSNASNSSHSDVLRHPPYKPKPTFSGPSQIHAQSTGVRVDVSTRPTHSAVLPAQNKLDISVSKQQVAADSDTETTLSSNSSEEVISPKRTLREAFKTRGPYAMDFDKDSHSNHTNKDSQNSKPSPPVNRNPTPGPRRSLSVASQNSIPHDNDDWRIVGQNSKTSTPTHTDAQQNPTVPKAQMRASLSSDKDRPIKKSHTVIGGTSTTRPYDENNPKQSKLLPQYQQSHSFDSGSTQHTCHTGPHSNAKTHSASQPTHQTSIISQPPAKFESKAIKTTSSSSDELDNPFKAMDEEEISSIVEKIPGRTTVTRSDSESDIMEKLEKSRIGKKTETLEERTARILGIHRRTSTDDTSSSKNSTSRNFTATSSTEPKKDLNAYMNSLLTGGTTVSPATKQKYLSSNSVKPQSTSPLTANSVSSNEQSKEGAAHRKSKILEKTSQHRKPIEESDHESRASDLEGNANITRASPVSPHGKMMLSYGNNIYAETPGFHKHQRSYDSSESDENDAADKKEQGYKVADNSPVLPKQSSDALPLKPEGIFDTNHNYDGAAKPNATGLSVWSKSRDLAKDKIAKSIGFNLQNVNQSRTEEAASLPISSDEYDIKILTVTGRKTYGEVIPTNAVSLSTNSQSSEDDDGRLEEVMQSVGLDPSAAWTMSV